MRELERDRERTSAHTSALAVIGDGRLGGAVARAATAAGLDATVLGRGECGAARGSGAALLCVPDAAIPSACEELAAAAPGVPFVGHTSGATGLDALDAAASSGSETFTLHPLQTVPDPEAGLAGAHCAIGGSTPAAREYASELGAALGMSPFEIPEESRAAYHAAAAIASNLFVALEESAAGLLRDAGIEDGRELLAPLVLRTAANWAERGPAALTGPIARGDLDTVAAHLAALEDVNPELIPVYTALAERARELAAEGAGA